METWRWSAGFDNHDTPTHACVFDRFTFLHAAFGVLAAWVLQQNPISNLDLLLIIASIAILWEVAENAFPSVYGPFFGLKDYKGDSWPNALSDVVIAVLGGVFGAYVPEPASYIVGFVLLGVGLGWMGVATWKQKRLEAAGWT